MVKCTLADLHKEAAGLVSGKVLQMARIGAGMTQVELAWAVGVHPVTVSLWETSGVQSRVMDDKLREVLNFAGKSTPAAAPAAAALSSLPKRPKTVKHPPSPVRVSR